MTDKITLATVGSISQNPTSAATTINSNFGAIQTEFDNTLSRDGTQPNQMFANLDMNSNRILNLSVPISSNEPMRLQDLANYATGGSVTFQTLPTGGTTGQILTKNSNSNYDFNWSGTFLGNVTGNLTGNVTGVLTGSVAGDTTGTAASAGQVGEVIQSANIPITGVSLTSGTYTQITTISLSPGDWDVNACIGFATAGGATQTEMHSGISTTPPPTVPSIPDFGHASGFHVLTIANQGQGYMIGPTQILVTVNPTIVYLGALSTFSGGTCTTGGYLRARRMR